MSDMDMASCRPSCPPFSLPLPLHQSLMSHSKLHENHHRQSSQEQLSTSYTCNRKLTLVVSWGSLHGDGAWRSGISQQSRRCRPPPGRIGKTMAEIGQLNVGANDGRHEENTMREGWSRNVMIIEWGGMSLTYKLERGKKHNEDGITLAGNRTGKGGDWRQVCFNFLCSTFIVRVSLLPFRPLESTPECQKQRSLREGCILAWSAAS